MCRKLAHESKQGVDGGERKLVIRESDGTLKNLLKKSYLRRWIDPLDARGKEVVSNSNNEGKFIRSNSVDFARHVLIFGVCSFDFIISINVCRIV